jgi:hypothetical protein
MRRLKKKYVEKPSFLGVKEYPKSLPVNSCDSSFFEPAVLFCCFIKASVPKALSMSLPSEKVYYSVSELE